jgi:ribosome-binding protein aMBF1 (putative translation factor)
MRRPADAGIFLVPKLASPTRPLKGCGALGSEPNSRRTDHRGTQSKEKIPCHGTDLAAGVFGRRAMLPRAWSPALMTANKKTTDTDRKIGALIRKHRQDKGWALTNLAAEIGVTYQQLQKYERGVRRQSRDH